MKRLSVVFTLIFVLLLSTVFMACGGGKTNLKDIYSKDYSAVKSRTYVKEELPQLSDYILYTENEDFVLFSKVNVGTYTVSYRVFSKKTFTLSNEIVSSTKLESDLDFNYNYTISLGNGYYQVVKKEKSALGTFNTKTARFNVDGVEIYNSENSKGSINTKKNFFICDNTICYRDDNGVFVADTLQVPGYKIPKSANIEKVGNYFVDVTDGVRIVVYDKNFDVLIEWQKPSYVSLSKTFVCNEFAIVQYEIPVHSMEAKRYDLIKPDDTKVELKTLVLNYKEKQIREVKTEFIIDSITNVFEFDNEARGAISKGITNVASIYYVKDKRVDKTNDYDFVALKQNCEIEKSFKVVDRQISTIPVKLDKNLYLVATQDAIVFLNEKGETVDRSLTSDIEISNNYLCIDKKLYDYSFNETDDFSEYSAVVVCENYIGLKDKNDKFYIYSNGEKIPLDGEKVTFENGYYVVEKKDGLTLEKKYELCLVDGTVAYVSKNAYVTVFSNDNGALLRTNVETGVVSQTIFLSIKVSK